jgi:hypothetical protein
MLAGVPSPPQNQNSDNGKCVFLWIARIAARRVVLCCRTSPWRLFFGFERELTEYIKESVSSGNSSLDNLFSRSKSAASSGIFIS